jgi:hypothetical protein
MRRYEIESLLVENLAIHSDVSSGKVEEGSVAEDEGGIEHLTPLTIFLVVDSPSEGGR